MKYQHLALGIIASIIASSSVAQDIQPGWVGVFGEHYEVDSDKPLDNTDMDDGTSWGAEIGIGVNEDWAVRLEGASMQIDHKDNHWQDWKGTRFGVDAMYFIGQPDIYTFVGYKVESLDQTYRAANLGLGKHWDLSERWKVITEAATYYDLGDGYNDFGIKLGLAYKFGDAPASAPKANKPEVRQGLNETAAPVEQAPKDSDNDGIADSKDQCANTPSTDKVDAQGCSIFVEKEVTQRIKVLFANNSAEVNRDELEEVAEFAEFMRRYPNTSVVIEGHASTLGDADYNMSLSQQRAESVRSILISDFGIDASRLNAKGYGESRPVQTGNTAEAHRQNRRIEAVVTATEKVKAKK